MNLPSEVPPSVEHTGSIPLTSFIESLTAFIRSSSVVRKGFPPMTQSIS